MVINKALLKYGYSSPWDPWGPWRSLRGRFKLEILEYCDLKVLAKRKQYYMELFSPEYNVLITAYSSLGYKHSEETLVKIHKNIEKLNLSKSVKVIVTNLEINVSTEYVSLREAAVSLNTNKTTLN